MVGSQDNKIKMKKERNFTDLEEILINSIPFVVNNVVMSIGSNPALYVFQCVSVEHRSPSFVALIARALTAMNPL
jgi:hypothetical protein